MISGLRSGVN